MLGGLLTKTNYNTQINETEKELTDHNHDKHITTLEFNTLGASVFNRRLAQAKLITKTDFDTKLLSLNRKIMPNKPKHLLVKNDLKKLEEGLVIICLENVSFDEGEVLQVYLIFQPIHRYFKIPTNTKYISERKSKGLSDESIKPRTTSDNSLAPLIDYVGYKKFNGSCLKQPRVTYTHGKAVNIYIAYELAGSSSYTIDPTLKNCLFGAVTLTKNFDTDNHRYSGYGIRLDRKSSFSFPGGGFGQYVITFGVDISSSVDIKKKYI